MNNEGTMKVFIVNGTNKLMRASGPIAVAVTKEKAEKLAKDKEYLLDDYRMEEFEVEE